MNRCMLKPHLKVKFIGYVVQYDAIGKYHHHIRYNYDSLCDCLGLEGRRERALINYKI